VGARKQHSAGKSQSSVVYSAPKKSSKKVSKIEKERLDLLISHSNSIIFECKSKGLIDFHPDMITICSNRVTITYRSLLSSFEYPIPLENLVGARITNGLFYSSLYINTFGYDTPKPLTKLKRRDARLARRYILALVECKKNGVDLTKYSLKQMREKLKDLGEVHHDSKMRMDL